jgi:hypothetical protein
LTAAELLKQRCDTAVRVSVEPNTAADQAEHHQPDQQLRQRRLGRAVRFFDSVGVEL